MVSEKWPPIYDEEDLVATIAALAKSNSLAKGFYGGFEGVSFCQGDVISLESPVPVIAADGKPAVSGGDVQHWLVIGNTCDLERELAQVEWSQIVPLIDLGFNDEIAPAEYSELCRYRHARRFYIPPWEDKGKHYLADFLRPVSIHKNALHDVAEVKARLSSHGWILLHSCLVRFLARGDDRFDE